MATKNKVHLVPQIAKELKCTRQRVYQIIKEEKIPHERIGKIYVIQHKDYVKYFKNREMNN